MHQPLHLPATSLRLASAPPLVCLIRAIYGAALGKTGTMAEMNAIANKSVKVRQIDDMAIHIVDGMFDPALIHMIHEICNRLPFSHTEYANNTDEEIQYLNHNFDQEFIEESTPLRFWKNRIIDAIKNMICDFEYELDRIHCNNQSHGDFQIVHTDIPGGITALYFVNHEWKEEWHGETVFYDQSREPVQIVSPRPGRLIVFPGEVLHRGGSPSRMCFEPRLTIAFKFRPGTPL